MQIGLLITSRCNAACTHCSTSCGPHRTGALSRENLFSLMDQAAAIQDGRPLVFSLSGGEPFLDFPLLRDVVAYGARLGGTVTCVTNGSWASSDDKARAMLTTLRDAGLRKLAVSTSRFHQQYVRLLRVRRAVEIGVELGLAMALKIATTRADAAEAEQLGAWARSVGVRRIEVFPVQPYLREGAVLREDEYLAEQGLPRGRCPAPSLTVKEDGTAYSCCAPGGFVETLSLGNAVEEGLRRTYRRFLLNGKQQLLRALGPACFARAARERGLGHLLRESYAGVCDLCTHISSTPALSDIARQVADDFEAAYVAAIRQRHKGALREVPGVPGRQGEESHATTEA